MRKFIWRRCNGKVKKLTLVGIADYFNKIFIPYRQGLQNIINTLPKIFCSSALPEPINKLKILFEILLGKTCLTGNFYI